MDASASFSVAEVFEEKPAPVNLVIMEAAMLIFKHSDETTQHDLVKKFLTEENFSDGDDEIKEAVAEMFQHHELINRDPRILFINVGLRMPSFKKWLMEKFIMGDGEVDVSEPGTHITSSCQASKGGS